MITLDELLLVVPCGPSVKFKDNWFANISVYSDEKIMALFSSVIDGNDDFM